MLEDGKAKIHPPPNNQNNPLFFFNFSFAIICYATCRSWQQSEPHDDGLICGFIVQTAFRKLNLSVYIERLLPN